MLVYFLLAKESRPPKFIGQGLDLSEFKEHLSQHYAEFREPCELCCFSLCHFLNFSSFFFAVGGS